MLKDITLGQYFPGATVIHRMDPRMKIFLTTGYIVILFVAKGILSYLLLLAWLLTAIKLSEIKLSVIFRGVRPLFFIISLTALLNMLYTPGRAILEFWILTITYEGIFIAIKMVARIVMLITGTLLLTYTTSPIVLTDGLEHILAPLKKLKVPVHELAMMMSIALRFIPTLIEEADKIINAQKARGADFETGSIFKRAKALIPLLVPLFISAFRRADELAIAMECRCYRGGEGRTSLRQHKYMTVDLYAMLFSIVIFTAVIVLRSLGI